LRKSNSFLTQNKKAPLFVADSKGDSAKFQQLSNLESGRRGVAAWKLNFGGEILMQKKVMALAVAGALSAPVAAFAQASNVQIYGRLNVGLDNYEAKGATAANSDVKGRMRQFDQGSRLGVRGSEDLGGGLKALFQIESGVNVDSGSTTSQSGSANSSAGTFASRDSYVGLEGGFGRFTMGRQAVYYGNGVIEQVTANYVNISSAFFSGSTSRIGAPTTRTNNVFAYTTPTMGGFNATAWYSPNSEAATAGQQTNGKIYGVTGRYSGIVNVQVDWGKNKKQTDLTVPTGTAAGDVTGTKIGVGWPYAPGAQIAVIAIQNKQDNATSTNGFTLQGDSIKQRGVGVAWEHVFGNIQALAEAAKIQKAKGCSETAGAVAGVSGRTCDGTEANSYMVGAKYLLSKRTGVYVTYNKITNKENANLDFSSAGYSAVNTLSAGADPRVWAIGVMHNF
jgi:predicted porin